MRLHRKGSLKSEWSLRWPKYFLYFVELFKFYYHVYMILSLYLILTQTNYVTVQRTTKNFAIFLVIFLYNKKTWKVRKSDSWCTSWQIWKLLDVNKSLL
jgi:hypothetical protein